MQTHFWEPHEEKNEMTETREFFESGEHEMQVGRATCYSERMTIFKHVRPKFTKSFIQGK